MRDLDFVRNQPVGVRHLGDGLAVAAPSEEACRVRRYLLVQGSQKLVWPFWREVIDQSTGEIRQKSEFRIAVCGRQPVGTEVRVYRQGRSVGYSGVMRCGNVWGCVICAAKVLRRRGDQIGALFDAVHRAGGSAVMVTFTAGHSIDDRLADVLGRVKEALRELQKMRAFRVLVADRTGQVVATEVTYNDRSGWHPHSHQAWFFGSGVTPDCERLAGDLFGLWRFACEKVGLETLEFYRGRRVGVDVRRAWDASEYLTKWGREREWSLSAEVTAGRLKIGKGGSLTPWGLLEDAICRGKDSRSAALWVEYLRATKGFHCVSLRGAKRLLEGFGLPTSYDDWVDANDVGEGEVIGTLSADAFARVVDMGGLGRLLEAARSGGLAGLDAELQSFSHSHGGVNHGFA